MVAPARSSRRSAATPTHYRGAEGARKADEELARQKAAQDARREQGNQPFRFRVSVGGTTQFAVCDDEPDFYRFEHNMKNRSTQKWDIFTGCVKEWDNCPACETAERESYYAMYLTVIDFTPFETRNGEVVEFSRKLLVVKPAQQKKFLRAYAKAQKEGRTLRGAVFEVTRDGDKDSAIGNDIEFIEYIEEDELVTYTRSWKDKEGKKHSENCHEVLDYESMFPAPETEALRDLVGGEPAPGSRAHQDRALGRTPARGRGREEPEGDYEAADRQERMGGTRPRRGAGRAEEPAEDDDPPARAPSRRPASRREEPAEDDAPPARTGRARGRTAEPADDDPPPPRTRRGAARAEPEEPPYGDEDAEPEEDAPRGRAPGVGRRVVARGRR